MPSLEETMRLMHSLLRGEKTPQEMAEVFNADPKRLEIYQRFVRNHVTKPLARNYAIFRRLVKKDIWIPLREEYFINYPATGWQLNASSEKFIGFISQKIREQNFLDGEEFYVELLQFEWEETITYCSEEVIPKPCEVNIPTLNPTLSIMNFQFPIGTFVSNWREKQRDIPWMTEKEYLKPQPQMLLLVRHPQEHKAFFHVANDRLLFAIKVVHDQINIEDAAKASGQEVEVIRNILQETHQAGVIVLPENF